MVKLGSLKFRLAGIALQVIAFNVDPWINAMLKNASEYVDKIFIAYPPRPWAYSEYARNKIENPTKLSAIDTKDLPCKVEIVHGDWEYDEDTRNCLLDMARDEDYDWMIIQDADEFYTRDSWVSLIQMMRIEQDKCTELIITPWYNFWKSSEYVIQDHKGSIKSPNEGFAIKCKGSNAKFIFSRTSNAKVSLFIDEPCYHYGYVISDIQMRTKIQTWAHTKEVYNPQLWYKLKWMHWTQKTINLHPGSPHVWERAVRFPLPQPEFGEQFLKYKSEYQHRSSIKIQMLDILWDLRAYGKKIMLQIKLAVRGRIIKFREKKKSNLED